MTAYYVIINTINEGNFAHLRYVDKPMTSSTADIDNAHKFETMAQAARVKMSYETVLSIDDEEK